MIYRVVFKRVIDVTAAVGALVVLSPFLVVVAMAIWLDDRGPALFHQERVGQCGRQFTMLKFRSMPVGVATLPSAAAATLRPTRVGQIIRRLNIDELPQLVNVLIGDMSLVGPRPALPSQRDVVALRREGQSLGCRPGLTGLAQVNSFDGMSPAEKVAYDERYASKISFYGDLKIILWTFSYLLKPPPVY